MSATVEPPSWSGAAHARNIAGAALRMTYQVRQHGAHHVGTSGPLLLVCRSEGILAGAVLHATVPRPVHVVANEAMSKALRQGMMAKAGVIPVTAPTAVEAQHRALAALRDERAVVVTGSTVPVGYLVAMTGVAVMPVVLFGAEGRVATDPPRPRSRIDVYFAPAVALDVTGDPLRTSTRASIEEQVRQLVSDAEELAAMRSGQVGP
jgi:1-acyl-sn-glycerol-3-phosphate acyltransferase